MTPSLIPILIVDNDKESTLSLQTLMEEEGYKVYSASSGELALNLFTKNKIDLVLCDQCLIDMNGIEFLRRAYEIRPEAIRILLTANADVSVAVAAINIGHVSQFISKPWNNNILKQTLRICLEKYSLEKENRSMQDLITEHHKELAKAHKSLKDQFEMGSRVHETLLLGQVPHNIPGVSVSAKTVSSHELDGDFFEFYHPLADVFDIVLGDVMGKGIPAALIATAVKTQLIRFAVPPTHTIIFDRETWWHEDVLKINEILKHVQTAISKELMKLEYFVSLLYARFDLKKRTLSFIDCGFTKPIHWKSKEKKAVALKGDNYPLGMLENDTFSITEVPFYENDLFLFYSDGVTEAKSSSGKFFDTELLMKLIEENAHESSDKIVEVLRSKITDFHEKESFDDELTLIVVKVDHLLPIDNPEKNRIPFAADLTQLKAARDLVGRSAELAPGDADKMSHDLKLAINEIFCNIVKHGYGNEIQGPILIEVEHDLDGIKLEVSDQGIPFNPLKIMEPSLFGDKDDGYGWYIIRQLVDQVMYLPKQTEGGWNHLRLYKKYCIGKERMELTHAKMDRALIITPQGENLDAKETPEFKQKVLKLIDENEAKHVVFDMKAMQFIDSSGLGCFLSILRQLNGKGGDLKLSSMSKPVRSMFELVSMHKIFEIYENSDDAIRSINMTSK